MKTARYHGNFGKVIEVEFDENAPCIICGEPVLSASMGGTSICPSCDVGKCRYCGCSIQSYSMEDLHNHMKLERERQPDLNMNLKAFYDSVESKQANL